MALTWSEYAHATQTALCWFIIGHAGNLNAATTVAHRTWQQELDDKQQGACSELAVAKLLRRYWPAGLVSFHQEADIPPDVEVRHCDRDDAHLIVRDNDPPERIYVLVTGRAPLMSVRGWIRGADARRDHYLRDPHAYRPAWFIPQTALTPLAPMKGDR